MAFVTIIEAFDGNATPSTYQLADGQTVEVLAARADFDGTGAAGAFVPQVSFYAQDGRKLGSFPAPSSVAMGASAGCTFFPTAPPSSGGGGGGGIDFDQANVGDWLEIDTTSTTHTPSVAFTTAGEFSVVDTSGFGSAITLQAQNGGNVSLVADTPGSISFAADLVESPSAVVVDLEPSDTAIIGTAGGQLISDQATAKMELKGGALGEVLISSDTVFGTFGILVGGAAAQKVGFFGATPVIQPGHPVTLGDVIALLTSLGLCA